MKTLERRLESKGEIMSKNVNEIIASIWLLAAEIEEVTPMFYNIYKRYSQPAGQSTIDKLSSELGVSAKLRQKINERKTVGVLDTSEFNDVVKLFAALRQIRDRIKNEADLTQDTQGDTNQKIKLTSKEK
jgi:hypothetical protein